jgi:predicted transcriptional regulator
MRVLKKGRKVAKKEPKKVAIGRVKKSTELVPPKQEEITDIIEEFVKKNKFIKRLKDFFKLNTKGKKLVIY